MFRQILSRNTPYYSQNVFQNMGNMPAGFMRSTANFMSFFHHKLPVFYPSSLYFNSLWPRWSMSAIHGSTPRMFSTHFTDERKPTYDICDVAEQKVFETALQECASYAKTKKPDSDQTKVYMSYARGNPEHALRVEQLAKLLELAGFKVLLDLWYEDKGKDSLEFSKNKLEQGTTYVLVIGSRDYVRMYNRRTSGTHNQHEYAVSLEARQIDHLVLYNQQQSDLVIPVILADEGPIEEILPKLLDLKIRVNFYGDNAARELFSLIRTMHKIDSRDEGFKGIDYRYHSIIKEIKKIVTEEDKQYYNEKKSEQSAADSSNYQQIARQVISKIKQGSNDYSYLQKFNELLNLMPIIECYSLFFYPLESGQEIRHRKEINSFCGTLIRVNKTSNDNLHVSEYISLIKKELTVILERYQKHSVDLLEAIDVRGLSISISNLKKYLNSTKAKQDGQDIINGCYYLLLSLYNLRALIHRANFASFKEVVDLASSLADFSLCLDIIEFLKLDSLSCLNSKDTFGRLTLVKDRISFMVSTIYSNLGHLKDEIGLEIAGYAFLPATASLNNKSVDDFKNQWRMICNEEKKDLFAEETNSYQLSKLLIDDLSDHGVRAHDKAVKIRLEPGSRRDLSARVVLNGIACCYGSHVSTILKRINKREQMLHLNGEDSASKYVAFRDSEKKFLQARADEFYQEAETIFKGLKEYDMNKYDLKSRRILVNYARLQGYYGKWSEACDLYEIALQRDNTTQELRLSYAEALYHKGDYDEGLKQCENYISWSWQVNREKIKGRPNPSNISNYKNYTDRVLRRLSIFIKEAHVLKENLHNKIMEEKNKSNTTDRVNTSKF